MTSRLDYLRTQYASALLDAVRRDVRNASLLAEWLDGSAEKSIDADVVFQRYRSADPTRTGACTQWLIRQAIAGDLPAEDLPKAKETLEVFLAYKRRLKPASRDLGRHGSLGSVWKAVEHLVLENAATSGKDEERREREAVRAESEILLEQDGWTVAIPKTERAAKWWGRGTRWCTAAEQENMFSRYHREGPLVAIVRPDGAKFQFHGQTQQFMDAADRSADAVRELSGLLPRLKRDQPALEMALVVNSIAPEMLTPHYSPSAPDLKTTVIGAMTRFGLSYRRLPPHIRTRDICMAVQDLGLTVLAYTDPVHLDRAIIMRDLERDESLLPHVPELFIDREMVERYMHRSSTFISHVPRHLLDYDVCMKTVRAHPETLHFVPKEFLDDAMVMTALRKDGTLLYALDGDDRTYERCLAAVSSRPEAFRYVPAQHRDQTMCLAAVSASSLCMSMIPRELRTADVCRAAVRKNALAAFADIPVDILRDNRDLLIEAVRVDGDNIRHVPFHLLDQDLCRIAVESSPSALRFISRTFWCDDLIIAAVQRDGLALGYVPESMQTSEICLAAARQTPRAAIHMTPEKRSLVRSSLAAEEVEKEAAQAARIKLVKLALAEKAEAQGRRQPDTWTPRP